MSAKTTELKPCPFCGSGNVRYKEAELLKIADMRKRNPSDSAERRFFMLAEQALGAHQ